MKRWPLHKAHFWERAPFFKILLPFAAGIALYPLWKGSNTVAMFTALFAYILLATTALYKMQNSIKRLAVFLSVNAFFAFSAFVICYLIDVRPQRHWYGHTINTADLYLARIIAEPLDKGLTKKVQVEVIQSVTPKGAANTKGKAFLYLYQDTLLPEMHKGDTLLIPNGWQPLQDAGNPFAFDYARFCARNNIYHSQFLGRKDVVLHGRGTLQQVSYTDAAHEWCMGKLSENISDTNTLGLVQSMLIGDEINLNEDTRQAFTETGIVHVIAISGGNIAILFLVLLFLLRWLRHKKYLWLKYAAALPLVWFYVLMAGGSPSAMRAAVMFSLLALGFALQRRKDTNSLNHLFATAFILLIAEPMWLYSIGFQLSFVAVLSLILFYRYIYRWYLPTNKIMKALWSTIAASIAAEILVAPIVAYYFHTFPLLFIISNVVAYVLMGLVLILGMAIIGLSWIPAIAKFLGLLSVYLFRGFDHIIQVLRHWEPEGLHTLRLDAIGLTLLYLSIAAFATYLILKKNQALILALTATCMLLFSFCINKYHDLEQQRIIAYNVGKSYHIELISGNTYSVLATDTGNAAKKEYATKPAHIGWQALAAHADSNSIFSINGKTVAILRKPLLPIKIGLSTDHVIIAYPARLKDLKLIKAVLHPENIILSYSLDEGTLSDWKVVCTQRGIRLHPVQEGVFILD